MSAASTCVVAVASKYAFRTRTANIFNPAALALVAMFYVFDSGQSWWGALPELPPAAVVALIASGVFIADRVNKLPMVLAFLGSYYLLFTITAFVSDPGHVAEIFRAPDLHAVLYFAFFILTDPPTSPTKYRDQIAVQRHRRRRELRGIRVDRRRVLPAGRRARGQRLGSLAAPADEAGTRGARVTARQGVRAASPLGAQ